MTINLTTLLAERIQTPKGKVTIGNYEFDIIAVKGDYADLIKTSEDVLQRYQNAAIYGLRFGNKPLIELPGATEDNIHEIFSEAGLPDDAISLVAAEVLKLSGLEDLIYSEEDELLSDETDEEGEEEELTSYP